MTTEELIRIKVRAEKATPGPWRVGEPGFRCTLDHGQGSGGHGKSHCRYTFQGWNDDEYWHKYIHRDVGFTPASEAHDAQLVAGTWDYEEGGIRRADDSEFIAHARTDVPALVAEVERLRALTGETA